MNKYFRGCLGLIVVIVVLFAGMVCWYYWEKDHKQKQAVADFITYSKVCDTLRLITEKPSIQLQNFKKNEIDRLTFHLIREGKVINDTTVMFTIADTDSSLYTEIPFEQFLKTDTIVVQTNGNAKRSYRIYGFHHYPYLHYGMMGYLGSYDCRLDSENFMVNGKNSNGCLLMQDGITGYILP